jgi:hypothetical protein
MTCASKWQRGLHLGQQTKHCNLQKQKQKQRLDEDDQDSNSTFNAVRQFCAEGVIQVLLQMRHCLFLSITSSLHVCMKAEGSNMCWYVLWASKSFEEELWYCLVVCRKVVSFICCVLKWRNHLGGVKREHTHLTISLHPNTASVIFSWEWISSLGAASTLHISATRKPCQHMEVFVKVA